MRKLLNVFYATSPDLYLALDGENLIVRREKEIVMRVPLHNLESIVCFGYQGASPALMGACAERNIGLAFLSPQGYFLARVSGSVTGNVLLRKRQYRISDDSTESLKIARNFLIGKFLNCRVLLRRAMRDHPYAVDQERLSHQAEKLRCAVDELSNCESIETAMGLEGSCARGYFSVFDELILHQKEDFRFRERSRRPPLDNINALLSFLYTLLVNELRSALETVGLDPFIGFLHQDRPGRPSLALDLMEELRPVMADRLAATLINRRQISSDGFVRKESGGVLMTEETRKAVLMAWQERKREAIVHPFLKEKIDFGLIPYVQALLLARHLRGDLDQYPPFLWS